MDFIESERLLLRPFQESDFADTFAIYRQAEVCRFLLHEPWQTETAAAAFAKKCQQHALTDQAGLSLAVLHDQTVIGDLSVWFTGQPSSVEIGYAFHPSFGGQGFAQEALKELLDWLFA
ncbi:MAG: GNAT family N-acetyltransferase, partial [Enterococcus casseliflavus]